MSAGDTKRKRGAPEPETIADRELSLLIKQAGQDDPQLAGTLTQVFSAMLRTMIEQEQANKAATRPRPPLTRGAEPSDDEVEAAARAFWRYDLCGMLLYTGEHVLCDDERIPPYNRRLRCECRRKSRATLKAAARERLLQPAKANDSVAKSLAALTLAFQKARPASEPTFSMAKDVWVANAGPSVETTFSLDPSLVPTAEQASASEPDVAHAMTWQPIKTAPKQHAAEGRRLHHLLYDPSVGVTTGFWLEDAWGGSWYRTSPSHELLTPTHWMPLPEPPGE